jgi:hypothetical protein
VVFQSFGFGSLALSSLLGRHDKSFGFALENPADIDSNCYFVLACGFDGSLAHNSAAPVENLHLEAGCTWDYSCLDCLGPFPLNLKIFMKQDQAKSIHKLAT